MNIFRWTLLTRIARGPAIRYTALTPVLGFFLLWSNQFETYFQPLEAIAPVFADPDHGYLSFLFSNTISNTVLTIYFGLVFLGFGYMAYSWFCPSPIQNSAGRQDFVQREIEIITPRQLTLLSNEWLPQFPSASNNSPATPVTRSGSIDLHMGIQHSNADWIKAELANIVDTLVACYNQANLRYPLARFCVGVLFTCGLVLTGMPALRTLCKIVYLYFLAK